MTTRRIITNFSSRDWARVDQGLKEVCADRMRNIPVSVGRLASDLGLRVLASTLKPGVSGEIRPDTRVDQGYVIKVNRHEAKVRQRFTVAHEIGHYLLHRAYIDHGIVDSVMYRSNTLSGGQEAEANRIAADILMPRYTIHRFLQEKGVDGIDEGNVESLARYLKVSKDALRIRYGLNASTL